MGKWMIKGEIEGVIITPQKIIDVSGGDVLHAMKCDDPGFISFGEAYFSSIEYGAIKAWKRHREMTLNLVVPVGAIRFIMFDDRVVMPSYVFYQDVILSKENYCRLTVPPMIWLGFQSVSKETSILLNISSIPHDPEEVDRKSIEEVDFFWSLEK